MDLLRATNVANIVKQITGKPSEELKDGYADSNTNLRNDIEDIRNTNGIIVEGMGVPNELLDENTPDSLNEWNGEYDGWTFE
jgi:hypothetical protein